MFHVKHKNAHSYTKHYSIKNTCNKKCKIAKIKVTSKFDVSRETFYLASKYSFQKSKVRIHKISYSPLYPISVNYLEKHIKIHH